MLPSTSSGIPRSASSVRRTSLSAGSFIAYDRTPFGSMSVIRLSTRMTICGAWPARANVLSTSPARCGRGLTRWKAWPSTPSMCAMWSIAAATQSTGTMLVQPTSSPTSGNHSGSVWRTFWSALKK